MHGIQKVQRVLTGMQNMWKIGKGTKNEYCVKKDNLLII